MLSCLMPSHRHLELHHREMWSRVPQQFFFLRVNYCVNFLWAGVQLGPSRTELDPWVARTCMSRSAWHRMGKAMEHLHLRVHE